MTKMAEVLWGPEAWCKEAYHIVTIVKPEESVRVRMCLVGALTVISGESLYGESFPPVFEHPMRGRLEQAIYDVHGEGALTGLDIEDWQDQPERTWERDIAPVVAQFDALTLWAEGPQFDALTLWAEGPVECRA